jgi:hypothetical protein
MSATDGEEGGWDLEQSVKLYHRLKSLGVDLVDCSSGGNLPQARIPVGPGYQTAFAERIRRDAGVASGAIGLITSPVQADHIIRNGQADLVLLAREFLRDPYWPLRAARELGQAISWPAQYLRAAPDGAPQSVATVAGQVWLLGATAPGSFTGTPGADTLASPGDTPYAMSVTTQHVFAAGQDGDNWSRVRSVRALGELAVTTHTYTALLDQRLSYSQAFTMTTPGATTWPTDRYDPEWRLPVQKCASIQVGLSANPATAAWTALELRVLPAGTAAPAYRRN